MKSDVVVNLNDRIHVKLTKRGRDLLILHYRGQGYVDAVVSRELYDRTLKGYLSAKYPGYHCFQIWEFMQIYGNRLGPSWDCACSMRVYMEMKDEGEEG